MSSEIIRYKQKNLRFNIATLFGELSEFEIKFIASLSGDCKFAAEVLNDGCGKYDEWLLKTIMISDIISRCGRGIRGRENFEDFEVWCCAVNDVSRFLTKDRINVLKCVRRLYEIVKKRVF